MEAILVIGLIIFVVSTLIKGREIQNRPQPPGLTPQQKVQFERQRQWDMNQLTGDYTMPRAGGHPVRPTVPAAGPQIVSIPESRNLDPHSVPAPLMGSEDIDDLA